MQDSAVLQIKLFIIPGIHRTLSSSSAASSGFSVASETSGAFTLHLLLGSSFSPRCFSSGSDSSARIISSSPCPHSHPGCVLLRFRGSTCLEFHFIRNIYEEEELFLHLPETHIVLPYTLTHTVRCLIYHGKGSLILPVTFQKVLVLSALKLHCCNYFNKC